MDVCQYEVLNSFLLASMTTEAVEEPVELHSTDVRKRHTLESKKSFNRLPKCEYNSTIQAESLTDRQQSSY